MFKGDWFQRRAFVMTHGRMVLDVGNGNAVAAIRYIDRITRMQNRSPKKIGGHVNARHAQDRAMRDRKVTEGRG